MSDVITEIELFFRRNGYDISDTPQEKTYTNQVIILLDTIDTEVESQNSYFVDITLIIKYYTDSAKVAIEKFKTLPFQLEAYLRDNTNLTDVLTIYIDTPTIVRDGRWYTIETNLRYKEQIIL